MAFQLSIPTFKVKVLVKDEPLDYGEGWTDTGDTEDAIAVLVYFSINKIESTEISYIFKKILRDNLF